MSGLQIDPCVSSSGAQKDHILTAGNLRKNAVKSRPQLVPTHVGTLIRNERLRKDGKDTRPLDSVLEQALVTTAVGEAYC